MKTLLIIFAILFATEAQAFCPFPFNRDPYAMRAYEQCNQMEEQTRIQRQMLQQQQQQMYQQQLHQKQMMDMQRRLQDELYDEGMR